MLVREGDVKEVSRTWAMTEKIKHHRLTVNHFPWGLKRHFVDKGPYNQSYGFFRIVYGCESWTLRKSERWRTYAFELWCWRRLLRLPWKARRANQSIWKEINPEYSLERLMLKLKFQYFGHLMQTADSLGKTLMLGKIESRRRRGKKRMRWHHWFKGQELEQTLGTGEGQRSLVCCSPWVVKGWTQFGDWTSELEH